MIFDGYTLGSVRFDRQNGKDICKITQGGVTATYDIEPAPLGNIKYVLMDLDGTSVESEEFWISLIEKTVQELLKDTAFHLSQEDIPFVSGFTTIAHLEYCIEKYKIPCDTFKANETYHKIAEFELNEILEGRGNVNAFHPRPKLKEFLLTLKEKGIKIGLATSGLDYKAIPEVVATFRNIGLEEPFKIYDAVITGGRRKQKGEYGTMGELVAKPHPWLYAELGLGLKIENKSEAVVLEDSSSGVIAARTAGYPVIGFADGNIVQSGLQELCAELLNDFDEVLQIIDKKIPVVSYDRDL